jgi:murein DD-endopeptidase MepM/ murein hydrolase activator NlpD
MNASWRNAHAGLAALLIGALCGVPHVHGQDPASFEPDPLVTLERQTADALQVVARGEERKARLDAELAGLGDARTAAEARLKSRARALYRLTRAGMLPLMGGIDALLSHIARVNRLKRMVEHDATSYASLAGRGATLHAELNELARDLAHTRTQVRALETRKATLVAERQAQPENPLLTQANSMGIETPVVQPSGITELPYGTLRVVGDDEPEAENEFESERGRLSMPVSGEMQIRDDEGPGTDGPGLTITLRANTSVRSVSGGRIVFAGAHASHGRLVIVDHGNRYFTVYGGLAAVDVRVGDDVSRGARLGTVGGTSDLRFEVRRGTRNLDPRDWLGL